MSLPGVRRWLLIGNSRWHWAEQQVDGELRGWDAPPGWAGKEDSPEPVAWAAVGPVPDGAPLPPGRRVESKDVPLPGCPPWLGVDRALAGWGAWRELGESVLVVDAGTVLSLTRVDGQGAFRGGRLMAGLRLQLEAMGEGTLLLPRSLGPSTEKGQNPGGGWEDPAWPWATAAAMRVGVETSLAAAVTAAAREADSRWVVFTGGDGPDLHEKVAPQLRQLDLEAALRPQLCLESLAGLRPGG